MSYKGHKKTFEGASAIDGDQLAIVDAELLNWLSFQILATLAGGTVDIDFTVEESNDGTNWIATSATKNYTAAGAQNDILAVSQATSRFYRVIVDITNGTVGGWQVVAIGKG